MTRPEVEKAVVEFFRVCHRDLEPQAIEAEIDARMARISARKDKPKAKPKTRRKYSQFIFK